MSQAYQLNRKIPIEIRIPGYPRRPETFGDYLRKALMDACLRIRELAVIVRAREDSVINWELRGVSPGAPHLRKAIDFILGHSGVHVTREGLMKLIFSDDPTYPTEAKTLGDEIRSLRTENLLSIKQLAEKLGVNECTTAGWELGRS